MPNVKGLLQSKTFWGIIIAGLAALGGQTVRTALGDETNQAAIADTILELFGLVLALYGRITAKAEIKGAIHRQP